MSRDSYIVRIYNRPEMTGLENESESITGVVEDADTGTKYTFHNMEDLWGLWPNIKRKHQTNLKQ